MKLRVILAALLFASTAALAAPVSAVPSPIPIPPAAQAGPHFDPEAATEAYLALIPPDAKARSDAYFEGGYWLLLWDFLYGAAIAFLLLHFRVSAAMRNFAERIVLLHEIPRRLRGSE
jgi:STE24 endopeptidase